MFTSLEDTIRSLLIPTLLLVTSAAGAQIAVLQGNPFGDGVYTLRLKMPNGYTIPPHFHPPDEMVTVISGNFQVGLGDPIDEKAVRPVRDHVREREGRSARDGGGNP